MIFKEMSANKDILFKVYQTRKSSLGHRVQGSGKIEKKNH
jgi:hypothetical protein